MPAASGTSSREEETSQPHSLHWSSSCCSNSMWPSGSLLPLGPTPFLPCTPALVEADMPWWAPCCCPCFGARPLAGLPLALMVPPLLAEPCRAHDLEVDGRCCGGNDCCRAGIRGGGSTSRAGLQVCCHENSGDPAAAGGAFHASELSATEAPPTFRSKTPDTQPPTG